MSDKEETTDKPTEEKAAAAAAKPRKIVRRSASTRDNPAFTEEGKDAPAAEATPAEAAAPAAPAADAKPAHRRFDARAPRAPQAAGPSRPRPPRRDGDFRPPPARPAGARPIPGGPRAPSSGEEGGDFRPPPARPMGARPIPGGSRAPAQPGEERRERRPRPEGDRGPRPPRPEGDRGPRPAGRTPAPRPESNIEVKPVRQAPPPPAPVKAAPKAPPPAAVAKPVPKPVFIPLARAGQVADKGKAALTPKEALAAKTKAHAKPAPKPAAVAAKPAELPALDPALANVSAEEAVAALVKAGDAGQALIDAWITAGNAGALVEASEADDAPAAFRKAGKRALGVLRSRGVAIPARLKPLKTEAEAPLEATMIPPDGSGTIAITITRKEPSGRFHIAEVILREPVGILQAGSGWVSGTQLKEGRARALSGLGTAPVPVPVEWARARIAAARKLNATSGQIIPLSLDGCKEMIEPAPEAEPAHPLADLEATLDAEHAGDAIPTSASLHSEPEFGAWLPDRGALDEMLQHVGERLGPQGVSDPAAVNTALREELEAATDRFFSPEIRAVVANRMRDSAISLRARKGDRRATEVLYVAKAVREAGLITAPPREVPFLVTFFNKALTILAQQSGGQLRVPVAAAT